MSWCVVFLADSKASALQALSGQVLPELVRKFVAHAIMGLREDSMNASAKFSPGQKLVVSVKTSGHLVEINNANSYDTSTCNIEVLWRGVYVTREQDEKGVYLDQKQKNAVKASNIDSLVDRFLKWKLPASVCSDVCVTDKDYAATFPGLRSGTNLLTDDEARQMIEHLLAPDNIVR